MKKVGFVAMCGRYILNGLYCILLFGATKYCCDSCKYEMFTSGTCSESHEV